MASGEDLRRVALSLPEALERPHFDRTSFRVDVPKGKIFATMPEDPWTANLMLDRETQAMLCGAEPDIFRPVPNKWGEKGATMIQLGRADLTTLTSALVMAWKLAAPERLHAALDRDEA